MSKLRHRKGTKRQSHHEAGARAHGGGIAAHHQRAEGGAAKLRADRRARGGSKWIQKAVSKHPGALHRALHVPEGEKIPAEKMAKASHSENPRIRKMVGLAKTLKKMH